MLSCRSPTRLFLAAVLCLAVFFHPIEGRIFGCGGGEAFAPAPARARIDQLGSVRGKTITSMAPGSILVTNYREIHTFVDGAAEGSSLEPVQQDAWSNAIGNRLIIDVATRSSGQTRFVVFLTDDGTIWSLGNNTGGRLGIGVSDTNYFTATPMQVNTPASKFARSISIDDQYGAVVYSDGTVAMWGFNDLGGNAVFPGVSAGYYFSPVAVNIQGQSIASVSISSTLGAACTQSGAVLYWSPYFAGFRNVTIPSTDICARVLVDGPNIYVQTTKGLMIIRNRDTNSQMTLTFPIAGERVTNFAVSGGALMMVTSSLYGNKMFSYGLNSGGILMLASSGAVSGTAARPAALLESFMSSLTSSIISFKSEFSVFYLLLANGELHGWAEHSASRYLCLSPLSIEIFDTQRMVTSTRDTEAVIFAPGSGDTLGLSSHAAILENGNVLIWNYFLDKGAIPTAYAPPANVRFVDVRVGRGWLMLLSDSGSVYTFGNNDVGQLGRSSGIGDPFSSSFGLVTGFSDRIVSISAGVLHPIACGENGRCFLWGAIFGFDGLGTTGPYSLDKGSGIIIESIDFSGLFPRATLKSIEWRHRSAYLLGSDGALFAFGDNSERQLCLGPSKTDAWYGAPQATQMPTGITPLNVQSGYGWVSILTTSGEIYSCGSNIYGSFGNGNAGQSMVSIPAPADLSALNGAAIAKIAVGAYHTILLTTDNQLWSFGAAESNGLGLQSVSELQQLGSYYIADLPTRMDQNGVLKDRKIISIQAGDATFISAVPFINESPRFIAANAPTIRFQGTALYDNTTLTRINPVQTNQGSLTVIAATLESFDVLSNGNLTAGTLLVGDVWFPDNQEILRSVNLGTIVPAPTVSGRISYVSAGNPRISIAGTNFGTLVSDISVSLAGPTTSCDPGSITVTDTLITCNTRLTDAPEVASGPIAAVVIRAGGSSDSGRGTVVGTMVPKHSVSSRATRFPINGRNLVIFGERFPASLATVVPVNITLTAGSQTGIPCVFSGRMTAGSLECSVEQQNTPINSTYRGVLMASVEIAGFTITESVALIVDPPVPDVTTNRRIPSNLASIRIGGSGFGNDTSVLTVSLELTPIAQPQRRRSTVTIACQPTLANNTFIFCTPLGQLVENAYVDAIVSVSGGASQPVRIGYIGASVSVNNSIDIQKVAQNADTIFIYGDGFAFGADMNQNEVLLSPGGPCIIRAAAFNVIECGVTQSFGSASNVKATVSAYGAQAPGSQPVIAQVVPTATITTSLTTISLGTTSLTINGQNFDAASTSSTRVWLSLNNQAEFVCAVQTISETSITCQTEFALNTSGTVTARVRAFYGNSSIVTVGRVVDPAGGGNNVGDGGNQITTGTVIGISVAVVAAVLIIAAVVVIFVRRRLQAIRNIAGEKVDVPTEMAHLFSIVSSDLTIISKLGEGAYGAVYLGKYARLRSHVAIKKLTGGGVHAAEFFREAALMMSIAPHPNVVRIHGMCQEQTNFSLVMEFLPNGAIDSWAAAQAESGSNEIESHMLYRFAHGIARGMAHLAASRIVHRDLAARNILLGSDYTPKVSDFGMSRVVSDESREGQTNSTVGPIKWMAPESLSNRTYSEKSDVFSYGVTLFEIVTGHAPYQGMDLLSVAVQVRDHGLNALKELEEEETKRNLQIPSYIKEIMAKCFKYSPEDRPSFEEIVLLLERYKPSSYADTAILEAGDDEHRGKKTRRGKGKATESKEPKYLVTEDPKSRYEETTLADPSPRDTTQSSNTSSSSS